MRGEAWLYLSGGAALQKAAGDDYYFDLLKRPLSRADRYCISLDLHRTYPTHEMFASPSRSTTGASRESRGKSADDDSHLSAGQRSLRNVLHAHAANNPTVGYIQGMGFVAGLLLVYMKEDTAFWTLQAITTGERFRLDEVWAPGLVKYKELMAVFGELAKKELPGLISHFKECGVDHSMYATEWFMSIFTYSFPFSLVVRLWDAFLCEGWKVVYRVALAQLKGSAEKLMSMQLDELMPELKRIIPRSTEINPDAVMKLSLSIPLTTQGITAIAEEYRRVNAKELEEGVKSALTDAERKERNLEEADTSHRALVLAARPDSVVSAPGSPGGPVAKTAHASTAPHPPITPSHDESFSEQPPPSATASSNRVFLPIEYPTQASAVDKSTLVFPPVGVLSPNTEFSGMIVKGKKGAHRAATPLAVARAAHSAHLTVDEGYAGVVTAVESVNVYLDVGEGGGGRHTLLASGSLGLDHRAKQPDRNLDSHARGEVFASAISAASSPAQPRGSPRSPVVSLRVSSSALVESALIKAEASAREAERAVSEVISRGVSGTVSVVRASPSSDASAPKSRVGPKSSRATFGAEVGGKSSDKVKNSVGGSGAGGVGFGSSAQGRMTSAPLSHANAPLPGYSAESIGSRQSGRRQQPIVSARVHHERKSIVSPPQKSARATSSAAEKERLELWLSRIAKPTSALRNRLVAKENEKKIEEDHEVKTGAGVKQLDTGRGSTLPFSTSRSSPGASTSAKNGVGAGIGSRGGHMSGTASPSLSPEVSPESSPALKNGPRAPPFLIPQTSSNTMPSSGTVGGEGVSNKRVITAGTASRSLWGFKRLDAVVPSTPLASFSESHATHGGADNINSNVFSSFAHAPLQPPVALPLVDDDSEVLPSTPPSHTQVEVQRSTMENAMLLGLPLNLSPEPQQQPLLSPARPHSSGLSLSISPEPELQPLPSPAPTTPSESYSIDPPQHFPQSSASTTTFVVPSPPQSAASPSVAPLKTSTAAMELQWEDSDEDDS